MSRRKDKVMTCKGSIYCEGMSSFGLCKQNIIGGGVAGRRSNTFHWSLQHRCISIRTVAHSLPLTL